VKTQVGEYSCVLAWNIIISDGIIGPYTFKPAKIKETLAEE
jgi:hypothetical protein